MTLKNKAIIADVFPMCDTTQSACGRSHCAADLCPVMKHFESHHGRIATTCSISNCERSASEMREVTYKSRVLGQVGRFLGLSRSALMRLAEPLTPIGSLMRLLIKQVMQVAVRAAN